MDLENHLSQLSRLNDLIKRKATGSTVDLSRTLGISVRSCQRLIRILRNLGAPIEYSKGRNSFVYYKENGRFVIAEWIKDNKIDSVVVENGMPHHSNL